LAFHELVKERVCEPAGMRETAFLRSDELPAGAAVGYLADGRTNVFHLPVRGSGDGGVYSTVADVRALWTAFLAGSIVASRWAEELVRPRSERYGLGFWLDGSRLRLEGMDAGVSFFSIHDPRSGETRTVVSNTTNGAWPLARFLREPT
jgi:CubicO group peptidase (beta-lactamase class C family)